MTISGAPVAIIPARGGSKRLPRKNISILAGKPIISYPIDAAKKSGLFAEIIVSTEDEEVAEVARSCGATVHRRPAELSDDRTGVVAVCSDYLERLVTPSALPPAFCCIYATAAFIWPSDLMDSYGILQAEPRPDVVMGVSQFPIHPYKAMTISDGFLSPMWPKENALQSQHHPYVAASNGTIYWSRTVSFLQHPTFYPRRLSGYVIPRERAIDIDTPDDLIAAERQMQLNLMSSSNTQKPSNLR